MKLWETTPTESKGDEGTTKVKFLVGYAALWVVLTAMADNKDSAPLAGAFAVSIAFAATVMFLPEAVANLGLASKKEG